MYRRFYCAFIRRIFRNHVNFVFMISSPKTVRTNAWILSSIWRILYFSWNNNFVETVSCSKIMYYRNYNLKLHSRVLFDELYLRIRSLAFHCGSVVLCHAMQNVFAKAIRKFMTQILLYFLLNTIIEWQRSR